ncbi:DUF771 domain-containing protein [Planococcus sp. FY231025]|uniref:DUF771 domain-containing protein n=1 Tax=Planococcus sp. FY231025 TaxID=3455699 RepID=UPI003F9045E7
MQKLNVELSIEIPAEYVLISKVEYEEMKSNELRGVYWTMKDLEARTKRSSLWLRENVLYPSKFRKELDSDNGGFVFYPRASGQPWAFQASKMAEFLDKNFHRIFKE